MNREDVITLDVAVEKFGLAVSLMGTIAGMQAENAQRTHRGESMAYVEEAFMGAVKEFNSCLAPMEREKEERLIALRQEEEKR